MCAALGHRTLVSLVALYAALFSQLAFSAPATAGSSKPRGKSRKKKTAAKTPAKPAPKPSRPAADIPAVVESAAVWEGCLASEGVPQLASRLGMEQAELAEVLESKASSKIPSGAVQSGASQSGGCTSYAAASGGEAGAASVSFLYTEPSGESRTLDVRKTAEGIVTSTSGCECRESKRRVLNLPVGNFADSLDSVSPSVPPNVRWQLNIVVPKMIAEVGAAAVTKPALDDESEGGRLAGGSAPQETEASGTGQAIRVVLSRYGVDEREGLESVELVDQGSGKRLTGAWWVERPDGPGVLLGMNGITYERLLWDSPVKYTRSSRGVGASTTTMRRKVAVKKGNTKSTVVKSVKVSEFHLGVDMTAPKGTDVHAVADAKVDFAGRRNGFGNVIILDHGDGYQTYYAHLSKIQKGIKAGAHVARGDIIGLVGSTGHSTAPHLHFETRKDTMYLDPFDESHELGFWLLTADEQERLEKELLADAPATAGDDRASLQIGSQVQQ